MIVDVKIEGTSPLLQHRFHGEGQPALKSKVKNVARVTDVAEDYLYENGDGIYQPSTHKNLIGYGVVLVTPDAIPHIVQDWEVDTRSVIVNRGRIMRSRPCFEKWALEFQLDIDDEEIPAEVVKDVLDHAGKRVGIGDFRPEKGGSFGRFHVTKWDVVEA